MDNQVFDEGAGPALSDSDNLLPIVDREKTKVGGKFAVISKARPPLFKCPNAASALSVADLKQAVNRRRIVSGKRPQAIARRASRWATGSVKSRRRRCTLSFMHIAWLPRARTSI
jgi:hypothetical protein